MHSIVFLFPGPGNEACGGLKVVCEYATRLAEDGFSVHIVYAGSLFWMRKSLYFKLTGIFRYLQHWLKGFSCRKWFRLNPRVKEHYAFSLSFCHVPKADRYIATNPQTAMYLKDYPVVNERKFYLIQGYENWGDVTDEILRQTYHYPLQKIVISSWLGKIMDEEHEKCVMIHNGFDFNSFRMTLPIARKDRMRIAMLYHAMERKGCRYGFEALEAVKKQYPQLRVNIFGVPPRPASMPDWYDYHQSPDRETLNRIYNESAVYLGCSSVEGWGLTVGEAMICGCAVVCTDNPGYSEMALDMDTALVSPVMDSAKLAHNILRFLQDDGLRQRIAEAGQNSIRRFTWDDAYSKFKGTLAQDGIK